MTRRHATSAAARQTRFALALDSIVRDVRFACRSFMRAPLAALTIVVTVGLGLGLVAAVYTVLNSMIFRVDAVHDPHALYSVARQRSGIAEPATFTRDQYDTLLSETDVFVDAFASTSDVKAWIDGVRREGRLVTGNFFHVLGVGAARGRVLTPADDEAGQPPVIVLSHRAWQQHFDSDADVLERTFRVNGTAMRIAGVMPPDFRGLEIVAAPDFWAPLAQSELFREGVEREGASDSGVGIVGRLRAGLPFGEAEGRLAAWDSLYLPERSVEGPGRLVLAPETGTVPRPAEATLVFMPLFFAFGLILLIGCANVANLLLARLVARQREIGIRLAIGASRRRVVWQLLTESLLLALLAAGFAFAVSRLVLSGVVYAITTSFPPDIGNLRLAVPAADWRVALFLAAGAILSTVLFALTPALRGTRVDLTRAIHGELLRSGRPGRTRNALVALQVAGSALLLICAAILLRGTLESATVDPGVRTADIVSVEMLDEARRTAVLDSLRGDPTVNALAAAWPAWLGGIGGAPTRIEGPGGRSVATYQFVSPEYFDVLGIELLRGRGFTSAERSPDEGVAVVAENVARELWPGADPLGQVLRIEPDPTLIRPDAATSAASLAENPMLRARTAVVIGITREVAGFQVGATRLGGSGIYLPTSAETEGTVLLTRVGGDLERARRGLVDRLAAIDPNVGEVSTLQALARTNTFILGTAFWLTLALGVLALLLTLSGLFSVLSYLVEQRTREIGVRMALGASRFGIGRLILLQCARPVGIGVAAGSALTLGVGGALLATPVAGQTASIVRLFDPVAYAGSLTAIVLTCAGAALVPALRAGRINPLESLRQD